VAGKKGAARTADELSRMRRRWLLAAAHERARIERDLHDGAQQRLVALGIKIGLLHERAATAGHPLAPELAALVGEVDQAIDELRALAHGIHPPLLHAAGLDHAVGQLARTIPLTVRVEGACGRRFGKDLETAVYFCCAEALQNASKHSGQTSRVHVRFTDSDGNLRFEIADDGRGFDPARLDHAHGITDMRDRVAAVGGELSITSAPGAGTVVSGRVPIRDPGGGASREVSRQELADVHRRLAAVWEIHGRPELAAFERDLAEHELRGAELARRRPEL
jgi:signal transduction histidine kinase